MKQKKANANARTAYIPQACRPQWKNVYCIAILADSIESLIGAIYLDGGFNSAKKFIKLFWGPYFDIKENNMQDPKTKLQELSQQKLK